MDLVITYVNGLDPLWQQDYERVVGKSIIEKRFRDWGTMPFLFRGIAEYMPFVENVFLVVARESQVPVWIDRSSVRIVLHEEIIPAEQLPVFNASAIEMYLHRIPGLAEQFIYLNDDCFPMLPAREEDFFADGKAVCHMAKHFCTLGHDFRILTKRCSDKARLVAGMKKSRIFIRPQHTATTMFKSSSEELWSICGDELGASVTPVREKCNYNQYVFLDYQYFKGRTVNKRISNRHFSLAAASADKICAFIAKPDRMLVCINDVQMSEEKFESTRKRLIEAFSQKFRKKCRFEL